MKLAEALMERKDRKARMEALKKRLYQNAKTEEGTTPAEVPSSLLADLAREIDAFAALVGRIHRTNATNALDDGTPLADALIQRDMLRYRHLVLGNLADHALPSTSRYSARELRSVATVDIAQVRRDADDVARACRLLDSRIQRRNWEIDLV